MGKVKDVITELEEALNPTHDQIVMFRMNGNGFLGWAPASFWDNPLHEHYKEDREEVARFDDLYEMLAAKDAFNLMMHGRTKY